MSFPLNGKIAGTQWAKIARKYIPPKNCRDINKVGLDFLNYLQFHRVNINHSTVPGMFKYFCKNIAERGHK